ncbi:hypothetical protein HanRHA438_Chr03g0107991 [Helianthus annuus]|uniref:Uncharacterized protein n=1 Tax=Helianthus annuus TaxID=4232 RepID=A0A9K3JE78_HELAN|nr:hypothetical protein HanXRQr2_Chr03g0096881 [Helianthus annuus]KAJ0607071.1 hypothetical protein HanHA89_Chr03g0092281 [Helianthus annuus]KAJ0772979.1 hypothetical protein HanOQP8_Chr03g0093631 [Helianthus annuus]KAJ0934488.1 hypothetical protein HanRHA438_Chr03g0107991 [Helianthus annuus]KAJ0942559.1 hypothetical protein HanPSC8_Chr03g0093401 [Helianthus annuus]
MYLRTLFFLSSLASLSPFQTLIFIHSKPFSIVRSPINLKPSTISFHNRKTLPLQSLTAITLANDLWLRIEDKRSD